MRLSIILGVVLCGLGMGGSVTSAFAQVPAVTETKVPGLEGKFRLELGTSLFQYRHTKVEEGGRMDNVTFILGRTPPTFLLGVGYGLFDNLLLGLRFYATVDWRKTREPGADAEQEGSFAALAAPYVEYLFAAHGVVRPFVTGTLGFGGLQQWTDGPANKQFLFTLQAGGGLHVFIIEQLSFDATMMLGYELIHPLPRYSWSVVHDSHSCVINLFVGFSGWL